ncbi:MAG: ComF family protein [Flavobacteriales bacterium]|nr:ComF family protein [Flavobacteriales bacterium]
MKLVDSFLDILYPRICISCNITLVKGEDHLCTACFLNIPYLNFKANGFNLIERSLWGRCRLKFSDSYLSFEKNGITQKILHQLKYKGNERIGLYFGYLFAEKLKAYDFIKNLDYLMPVPLHPVKLRMRGFNQSRILCKGMQNVIYSDLSSDLERIANTSSQTRKKRYHRWENVHGSFILKNPEKYQNKSILLVDDVFTTGATLEACYTSLIINGIEKIGMVTLACAVQ